MKYFVYYYAKAHCLYVCLYVCLSIYLSVTSVTSGKNGDSYIRQQWLL